MNPNGILLCACDAAYYIDATTGIYDSKNFYGPLVGYTSGPVSVYAASQPNEPYINACLIGATATEIIVAFRGTLVGETEASYDDWLQDILAEPETETGLPGKVHYGFYTAVNSIFADALAQVQALQTGNLPVYITGHSKGGGMAPIFAYMLHNSNITAQQVVTFAAPRPGDVDFKTGYEAVFGNHMRFENYGDIVPLLPPSKGFDQALASFVSEYISSDLGALITDAANWNYAPVGSEVFIEENDSGDYPTYTTETSVEQTLDLVAELTEVALQGGDITQNIETALMNAHSASCGGGYWCGTVQDTSITCPAQSEDKANMSRALTKTKRAST